MIQTTGRQRPALRRGARMRGAFGVAAALVFGLAAATEGRGSGQATAEAVQPADALRARFRELRDAGAPAAEHGLLEPLQGRWTLEATWLFPGGRKVRGTGSCENRWILGGRFLESQVVLGAGESRLESLTIYGFDKGKKLFFALALTDLSTAYTARWGSYESASRSFLFRGESRNPSTGAVALYRELLSIVDGDSYNLERYYDAPGAPPMLVLSASFTRVPPGDPVEGKGDPERTGGALR